MESQIKEAAFIEVYEQYADALFRHCYLRISDREKAKDLTQTTFEKMWEYLVKGEQVQNAKAFLYKIANNLIIDSYRKKKDESLETMLSGGFQPANTDYEDIFKMLTHHEIVAVLNQLPDLYRDAIVMRYIDDLQPKEIARLLHVSENVVSVRIHRALEKIKTLLQH